MKPTLGGSGERQRNCPIFLLILAAILATLPAAPARAALPIPDGRLHKFAARDQKFFIDDQPFRIIAGEIHPGRIPAPYWEDRIKKARAMGLNTVSIYLFWNQIEATDGHFVFDGMTDIRHFVLLCADNGLWVVVRAGPYVCAEDEFGGFPAWLLRYHDIAIRTADPVFMNLCRRYVQQLFTQLGDLQVTHGGPILMIQFENELSAIDDYLRQTHDLFTTAGFDVLLFTCDHNVPVWNTVLSGIPGVMRAFNNLPMTEAKIEQSRRVNGPMGLPTYASEVYTGWFNQWGGPIMRKPIEQQLAETQWMLDHPDLSWCYYVFDGGTNFGFSASTNQTDPVQTSYDYDAPIDELGRVTPKYRALRDLFIKDLKLDLLPIPADPPVIEFPPVKLEPIGNVLARVPAPIRDDNVRSMEDLGQNFGCVLYRHLFETGVHGTVDLGDAMDYSIVMLDGDVVGEAFIGFGADRASFKIALDHPQPCTLNILVHNLGRISQPFNQYAGRKGLHENPTLDGTPITGWQMYSLPLDDPDDLPTATRIRPTHAGGPEFFSGTITIPATGETYLDMSNWHFGVVWVNGHNLGRFWEVGAARALYLPACWQKPGDNQITILEFGRPPNDPSVKGVSKMVETPSAKFAPLWGG